MLRPEMIEARIDVTEQMFDRVEPGWDAKINLETLDIELSSMCDVGQIYGSFEIGCKILKERGVHPDEFVGVITLSSQESGQSHREYAALTAGWIARIKKRRQRALMAA